MSENELIHEGWEVWRVDPYWLGTQWSYEEKQAMGERKPLKINRIKPFIYDRDAILIDGRSGEGVHIRHD